MKKQHKKIILSVLGIGVTIVLALLIVALLFFLPDLIWRIRSLLELTFSRIAFIDINGNIVSPDSYLEIMLCIIECFLTAFLAVIAHKLSKDIGKIQIYEQTAKQMLWAIKVANFVESNLTIVCNAKNSVPQLLKNLDTDAKDLYAQYIINLYSANLIDNSTRYALEEFIKKIKYLNDLYAKNASNTDSSLDAIANYYLDLGYSGMKYKKDIKDIIETLKNISEKGEE